MNTRASVGGIQNPSQYMKKLFEAEKGLAFPNLPHKKSKPMKALHPG